MIWLAVLIRHLHRMVFDADRRYTEVKRDTQEFVHVLLIIVDTRNPAVILYADGKISAVRVGHGKTAASQLQHIAVVFAVPKSDDVASAYAATYPFALVSVVIASQLLILLL